MTEEHCRRCPLTNYITGPTLTKEMPQMMKCIWMRAWTLTTSSHTNTQARWTSPSSSNILTVRVTKLNNRPMSKGQVELLSPQCPRTFMPGNRARRWWAAPMLIVFWARATSPLSEVPHQGSKATLKFRNRECPISVESAPFTNKFPRGANFLVDVGQKRYSNTPILFKRRTATQPYLKQHWVRELQALILRMVSALFHMPRWMVLLSRPSNLLCSPIEKAKTNIKVLGNQALLRTSRHSRFFLIRHFNHLPRGPTRRVCSWMTIQKTLVASRGSHRSELKAHPSTSRKSNRWVPLLQRHSPQLCIRKRIFNRTFWTQI